MVFDKEINLKSSISISKFNEKIKLLKKLVNSSLKQWLIEVYINNFLPDQIHGSEETITNESIQIYGLFNKRRKPLNQTKDTRTFEATPKNITPLHANILQKDSVTKIKLCTSCHITKINNEVW